MVNFIKKKKEYFMKRIIDDQLTVQVSVEYRVLLIVI